MVAPIWKEDSLYERTVETRQGTSRNISTVLTPKIIYSLNGKEMCKSSSIIIHLALLIS
jgi:hypothetical protein